MKNIPFYKMSGSGNDFIIVDNRHGVVHEETLHQMIVGACRRKMSVGADGFVLVENTEGADFKWRFYNSDGSRAEMCGNGARCVSRFAFLNGIVGSDMTFETDVGLISAQITGDRVKIRMTDPKDMRQQLGLKMENDELLYHSINTGVPHVVVEVENVERVNVVGVGRAVRRHEAFSPAGTNVNFVQPVAQNLLKIRTYERGVEDETLACGTGSVAAALIASRLHGLESPVKVLTRSGAYLRIFFEKGETAFSDIYLEGDARVIYTGDLWPEAWN